MGRSRTPVFPAYLALGTFIAAVIPARSSAQYCAASPPNVHSHSIHASLGKEQAAKQIPVAFHVLYNMSGVGNLSDSDLQNQIAVLSNAFPSLNFQFYLAVVTRTQRDDWFSLPSSGPDTEVQQALAVDPAHVMNVYIGDMPGDWYGWGSYPDQFSGESDVQHGILVDYVTFPGGPSHPYWDAGKNLVHEAGHYLGLYHVFQGGCIGAGDTVGDTPSCVLQQYMIGACPSPDTCTADAEPDPVHNYMHYTSDACRTVAFTEGQRDRMVAEVAEHRPSLGGSVINLPGGYLASGAKRLSLKSSTFIITGDLTVGSGKTLDVASSTLKFQSGKRLIANSGSAVNVNQAVLTAQGTSWGGVYYGPSSDGLLEWSTIEKVNSSGGGAVTLEYSNTRLHRNTIKNSTAHGIADLVSVNEVVEYNAITGNSKHAIYVSGSYGFFGANNVTATTTTAGNAAVYVTGGNPAIQRTDGVNTLNGGYYGIYATSGAVVGAGGFGLSQPSNRIFSNQTYEARAVTNSTIHAKYNYWGANGPQTNADGTSVVYSSPYTTTDPGAAFKAEHSGPPFASDWPDQAALKLLAAKEAADSGAVAEALALYESVARSASPLAEAAIAGVRSTAVRSRDPMAFDLLEALAEFGMPYRAEALEAAASARLVVGDVESALSAAEAVVAEFPGTDAAFRARMTAFYAHRRAGRSNDAVSLLAATRSENPGSRTGTPSSTKLTRSR